MRILLPCPKCNSYNIEPVGYTWWGGIIGPVILNHVKCMACNYQFNGKTGNSNEHEIIAFTAASIIITILIIFLLLF